MSGSPLCPERRAQQRHLRIGGGVERDAGGARCAEIARVPAEDCGESLPLLAC